MILAPALSGGWTLLPVRQSCSWEPTRQKSFVTHCLISLESDLSTLKNININRRQSNLCDCAATAVPLVGLFLVWFPNPLAAGSQKSEGDPV